MLPTTEQLARWLKRLVNIPSVAFEQAGPHAGTPGEAQIGQAIAGWFQALGGEVYIDTALPGRPNIYGIWRSERDRWAALDVHMDTVGVEQMNGDPFSGELRAGRVYGRGAVDTKASLAVALALLETLQQAGARPACNLLLAATVDEETLARGAPAFAMWVRQHNLKLDQLMVAEPTLCCPVHGHKGVVRLAFEVLGAPAHSSQPHLGKNAIIAAAQLALAFDVEQQRLGAQPPLTALGVGTLTVTMINGGRGLNVVPDTCTVSIDRRVVAGERATDCVTQLADLARSVSPLPLHIQQILAVDAFFQAADTPWVRQLAEWSGQAPTIAPYGTNAWAYDGLANECIVLGPGSIAQAHGVEEWVAVSELHKLATIYSRWWGENAT